MAEALKVGIIGYGRQGEVHAEVWANIPEAKLVAIADPDPKRLAVAIRKHAVNGCKLFETGELMLGRVSLPLDLVVVATQPADHCRLTLAAVQRGCHVICEKPMALTLEEADEMVAAALRNGCQLAVHFQTGVTKTVRHAQQLLGSGAIGMLRSIRGWCKGRPAPYDLMEVGGHVLHLMYEFAGREPVEVFGRVMLGWRRGRRSDARPIAELYPEGRPMGIGAGDYLFGLYRFRNGVHGHLELLTLPEGGSDSQYMTTELVGTAGRLRIQHSATGRLFTKRAPYDDFESTLTGWEEVDPSLWENDPSWHGPMREFDKAFLDTLRWGVPSIVSGEDGRMVLEMALGIYASHLAGKPLELPLKERKHPLR